MADKLKLPREGAIAEDGVDLLGFSPYAKKISEILVNAESPFMMSIYAPWGSGKSSMLCLVEKELKQDPDLLAVRFDAWDHENSSGLLPYLMIKIIDAIPPDKSEAVQSLTKVAKTVSLVMAGVALKVATGGTVDVGDITGAAELAADERIGLKAIYLDEHVQLKTDFKNALGELHKAGIKKLVLLIDDLDRCHPENIYGFIDNVRRLHVLIESVGGGDGITEIATLMALDKEIVNQAIMAKYPHFTGDPGEYYYKFFSVSKYIPSLHDGKVSDFIKGKIDSFVLPENENVPKLSPPQISMLDSLQFKSDGKITLRHLTTFLRQFYMWAYAGTEHHPMYTINDKDKLFEVQSSLVIPLAMLGILYPKGLREILRWDKKYTFKALSYVDHYLRTVKGNDISGPMSKYKQITGNEIEIIWKDFDARFLVAQTLLSVVVVSDNDPNKRDKFAWESSQQAGMIVGLI